MKIHQKNRLAFIAISVFCVVGTLIFLPENGVCSPPDPCTCSLQNAYNNGQTVIIGKNPFELNVSNNPAFQLPTEKLPQWRPGFLVRYTDFNPLTRKIIYNGLVQIHSNNSMGRISLAAGDRIDDELSFKNHQFSILNCGDPGWTFQTKGDNVIFNLGDWRTVGPVSDKNSFGKVGISTYDPAEKLDVNGAIRIGNTDPDDKPKAGTIRWNANNNHFEGYNGTQWRQLDN